MTTSFPFFEKIVEMWKQSSLVSKFKDTREKSGNKRRLVSHFLKNRGNVETKLR